MRDLDALSFVVGELVETLNTLAEETRDDSPAALYVAGADRMGLSLVDSLEHLKRVVDVNATGAPADIQRDVLSTCLTGALCRCALLGDVLDGLKDCTDPRTVRGYLARSAVALVRRAEVRIEHLRALAAGTFESARTAGPA